jgi:hypothetical protein
MGLAPQADALGIIRVAEIISLGRAAQPAALTGGFAGLAAGRLVAIKLVMGVAVIGSEELLAATALTLGGWGAAHKNPKGRKTSRRRNPPLRLAREENQEGRRLLNEDLEENPRGRKRNFKPPRIPHFHFAAHSVKPRT